MNVKVYLGGPINGCTDEEATGWREAVKPLLESLGHTWIDPMVRGYRGREMEPGIAAEIVENDKADIAQCNGVCPVDGTKDVYELTVETDIPTNYANEEHKQRRASS